MIKSYLRIDQMIKVLFKTGKNSCIDFVLHQGKSCELSSTAISFDVLTEPNEKWFKNSLHGILCLKQEI